MYIAYQVLCRVRVRVHSTIPLVYNTMCMCCVIIIPQGSTRRSEDLIDLRELVDYTLERVVQI